MVMKFSTKLTELCLLNFLHILSNVIFIQSQNDGSVFTTLIDVFTRIVCTNTQRNYFGLNIEVISVPRMPTTSHFSSHTVEQCMFASMLTGKHNWPPCNNAIIKQQSERVDFVVNNRLRKLAMPHTETVCRLFFRRSLLNPK